MLTKKGIKCSNADKPRKVKQRKEPLDSKIKEVKEFIDKNMLISIHRDKLAKKACMSVWGFSRKFKECTGESVKNYIDNLKLNYAKKLLAEKRLTIKEISEKLGFSEPKNFYRYFKKRTSKTPCQYRMK